MRVLIKTFYIALCALFRCTVTFLLLDFLFLVLFLLLLLDVSCDSAKEVSASVG